MKLGHMAQRIEAVHAWTESIVFMMNKWSHTEAMMHLGDRLALLKSIATQTMEHVTREAVHIFGGSGVVAGGPGMIVEQLYRTTNMMSIPGGADDVLVDFGSRSIINKVKRSKI